MSFTFDDGPDPACTAAVLDALRDAGATATFFVLGEAARRHPDLVRRAVSEGHEIALHGESHRALLELSPPGRVRAVLVGRRSVRAVTGTSPRWFRAPYGKQTAGTVLAGRLLGMRSVMWSTYAREWEDHSVDACVGYASAGLGPGSVVLLHDGHEGAEAERGGRSAEEVVAILRGLLDVAEARGLRVVSVGELLRGRRPRRRVWLRSWRVDDA